LDNVVNMSDYKEAKSMGVSITAFIELKKVKEQALEEYLFTTVDDYYVICDDSEENWAPGYTYILTEDIDSGYHDDCDHNNWSIVEEGYQATCNDCSLNAWSAPW